MVRYYGRAKTRVGSVNTNQLGLKMSGCPSKIGKQGALVRYQSRRAKCNQKFIGPVYYHGQMWSWNNTGVDRAPRNQSFNSGVGHINAPRFGCAPSCSTDLTYEQALIILYAYFKKFNLSVALFAKRETLQGDLNHPISKKLGSITHYETGSANFNSLPASVQKAVLVINNIGYRADVKGLGKNLVHVVGTINKEARIELFNNGYGSLLYISENLLLRAFGNSDNCVKWWGKCLTCNEANTDCVGCGNGLAPGCNNVDKGTPVPGGYKYGGGTANNPYNYCENSCF